MDLHQSPEQRDLQEAVRQVCTDALADGATPLDAARAVAELGVFDLRVPADQGGLGLGLVDTSLIVEQSGAALLPGWLSATHLAHTWFPQARAEGWQVGIGHRVEGVPGGWTVTSPAQLTHVLLDADELRLVELGGILGEPIAAVDPDADLHALDPETAAAVGVLRGADLTRFRLEVATLHAAYQVGVAHSVLERTTQYVCERHQFGVPVGSFQAVKHALADMLVSTEIARSAVLASAAALDDGELVAARRLAPAAVRLADRAAVANGRKGVQLHGGMGFAWEVAIHLYLKRAWALAATSPSVLTQGE